MDIDFLKILFKTIVWLVVIVFSIIALIFIFSSINYFRLDNELRSIPIYPGATSVNVKHLSFQFDYPKTFGEITFSVDPSISEDAIYNFYIDSLGKLGWKHGDYVCSKELYTIGTQEGQGPMVWEQRNTCGDDTSNIFTNTAGHRAGFLFSCLRSEEDLLNGLDPVPPCAPRMMKVEITLRR